MKKIIASTIGVIAIVILCALVFDWGRRGVYAPALPNDTSFSGVEGGGVPRATAPDVYSLISVNTIKENQTVTSPINLSGKAVGSWYFEATFPIELVDSDGTILATTTGQAQGDWATTSFVSFTAQLSYVKATTTRRALIVLSNDNPSGDPETQKQIFIPVILK